MTATVHPLLAATLPDSGIPPECRATGKVEYLIPTGLIRPFAKQPRKTFDGAGILALAQSIQEAGQRTPISVKRITDDPRYSFELINGERRLRACTSAGIQYMRAYVEEVGSEDDQFLFSVIANFCSAEHTPLEITFAMQRIRDRYIREGLSDSDAVEKTARVVGRSKGWVYQYLGFARLCPEVQEFMDRGQIKFQIGVRLSNLTFEAQREYALHIIQNRLNPRQALHYIRTNLTDNAFARTARRRKPSADYVLLLTSLKRIGEDVDTILDMKYADVARVFHARTVADTQAALELLREGEEGLQGLRETMEQLLLEKKKALAAAAE
jgi:ParB family transcriptional regulator, chromosome partitioning protein